MINAEFIPNEVPHQMKYRTEWNIAPPFYYNWSLYLFLLNINKK